MGSRCLISFPLFSQCKWLDGLYLMEIDRVLRPGGYWIFSGPPINWKANYKGSEVGAQELEQEQARLEDLAVRLCWKKVAEKGAIAVWRKPNNHIHCIIKSRIWKSPRFCINSDPDAGWYKKMEPCIAPLLNVTDIHDISGGSLEKWSKRLNIAPPRTKSEGISDCRCEAFSTYPRTYDLIHAHGVFSMYMDKCSILDILLEMHRILRPEGAVIIRDHVDIIVEVKGIAEKMKWNGRILHSENGAFHPEKILLIDTCC
ncbi:hypothetical protein POTOM_028766 [Populus tomentosa]|uniref:Methyltransferase n=1 Tax=Populus tomentosa TaxID=118781 RepID=A0A8X8CLP1_POPTO|nr:hypothetical protein POTOM_028766 [Populus tomentosa]